MSIVTTGAPVPSDYFGVLWALAGIEDALILEHGATGTAFYNAVSFSIMNKQSPKGILFTTGLDEDDVVMGREDKLVQAVKELDEQYRPEIISLAATAVTSVIGLDLDGLIAELQPDVNARLLAFSGGGFTGDYTLGIRDVFQTLVDEIVMPEAEKKPHTVNLIGPTIDTFNQPSDAAEIKRLLELMGIRINTVFTQCTTVSQIRNLSSAALNIVTRDIGLAAAKSLQDRYGMPYHYGFPIGIRGTLDFMKQVAEKLGISLDQDLIALELKTYGYTLPELSSWWQRYGHLRVAVACPYDYALGLTRYIQEEWGLRVDVVALPTSPVNSDAAETFTSLGVANVLIAPTEKELQEVLAEANPHILFGSSYDFRLAPDVPVCIHAAITAYDYIHLFDGTPFAGFRGNLFLTQTLINHLNTCKEVRTA